MDDRDLGAALVLLRGLDEDAEARRSASTMRLREMCVAAVADRIDVDPEALGKFLSRLVRDTYLTDEAIEGGAGVEDICQFWHWFDRRMWPDRRPGIFVGVATDPAPPEARPAVRRSAGQLARR